MSITHSLWVERYRPRTLDEYIFQSAREKEIFTEYVKNREIPHLLLAGVQGSGKTTLAKILLSQCDIDESDILVINASDERGVDTFRDKVDRFISSYPIGKYRVVLLEEADMLTELAQFILRNPMETMSETARFILTCNYPQKIKPPIRSRCTTFTFKAPAKEDVFDYALTILEKEEVKPNGKTLQKIIDVYYPDVRKIVNVLQQNSVGGKLKDAVDTADGADYKFQILDLLNQDDWIGIRKVVCDNASSDQDFIDVYRFLYDNIHKSKKFADKDSWDKAIVIIAEHLYKAGSVADQEINCAACMIRLGTI